MDPDALKLLEFPTMQRILAGLTSTGPGQELAMNLRPLDDLPQIELELARTAEMLAASEREFKAPLGGLPDVRQPVRRAAAGGGPLEGAVLWQIATFCGLATQVGNALDRLGDRYPLLSALASRIPRPERIEQRIQGAIDASGTVKDDATPQLAELRGRIKSLRRTIEDTLIAMVHSPSVSPFLQYPNPSFQHDRYVLPVNARQKSRVRGIVHGTSDSGATIYIEPLQTIEPGNRLSEAQSLEEEVVREILWDMTRHVARESENLLAAQETLALVDLVAARARLAQRYRMVRPTPSEGKTLELRGARHPILLWLTERGRVQEDRREPDFNAVVPMDVRLGDDFQVLVVTGPNTGGKTVALKTVGLLCLMARAGLFVPAAHAAVPLYDSIYADIGDEQSLEQSLSTFSSHMGRIIRVLDSANAHSLVLLDEIGAGTDPVEGAALGQAVLGELVQRGCSAIVTTHLGQLKTFAAACPQAENACVDFDAQTLRPTYHLTIGAAGRSNALEIAERLGMPPALLKGARDLLDEASNGQYSSVLEQVQLAVKDAETRRQRAQWIEAEAEKLKAHYEGTLRRIREQEERTGADIGLKIRDDVTRLAAEANRLYDDVRFSHKPLARKMREVRDGLRAVLQRTEQLLDKRTPDRPIQPGDEVYIVKVHKWGRVDSVDAVHKRALVTVGNMQMEVDLSELVPWGTRQDESRGVP